MANKPLSRQDMKRLERERIKVLELKAKRYNEAEEYALQLKKLTVQTKPTAEEALKALKIALAHSKAYFPEEFKNLELVDTTEEEKEKPVELTKAIEFKD